MSSGSDYEPVFYRYPLPGLLSSISIRLSRSWDKGPTCHTIIFLTAKSNGTLVPKSLVLASYATMRIHSVFARRIVITPFFAPL